jgi:hypothetical protein
VLHGREDSGKVAIGDLKAKGVDDPDKPSDKGGKCHNHREREKIEQKNNPSQESIFKFIFYFHVVIWKWILEIPFLKMENLSLLQYSTTEKKRIFWENAFYWNLLQRRFRRKQHHGQRHAKESLRLMLSVSSCF